MIGINAAIARHGFDPAQRLSPVEAEALFAPPARF
jgi:hypothetical protein